MSYKSQNSIFNKVTNGKDGTSVNILGSFPSESALNTAHPTGNAGDSYLINGNLYVWNGSKWESMGNIQGPKGDPGLPGNGITSITREYYLSTSKTTQTGGSWSTTAPNWTSGKYLWIRDSILYTNSTTPVKLTPYCDNSWEAVKDVDAQILAWCIGNDRTHIDGSKIYTGTIVADALNVTKLSSITADLGTITAGTINSTTINSATINGGTINGSKFTSAIDNDSQVLELNNAMLKFDCVDDLDAWNYQLGLLGLQLNYKYKGASISSSVVGEASLQAMPYHIILKGNTTDKTNKTIFKASIIDETVECYNLKVTNNINPNASALSTTPTKIAVLDSNGNIASRTFDQLLSDINCISKSKVNKIWKQESFTSSTSMASTGVSVAIPKNSYYVMVVTAIYNNSKPKQLKVKESPIIQGTLSQVGETDGNISTTVCGYTTENSDSTITIEAQYNGATSNTIRVMGYYITL